MPILIFDYKDDPNIRRLINDYIWTNANNYSSQDVSACKTRIKEKIGHLNSEIIQSVYTHERFYKLDYRCKIDACPGGFEDAFTSEIIPHMKNQFIYEEAIYELIHDRVLFPLIAYSRDLQVHEGNDVAYITIDMHVQKSNREIHHCSGYIYMGFPYRHFRVSPIKK